MQHCTNHCRNRCFCSESVGSKYDIILFDQLQIVTLILQKYCLKAHYSAFLCVLVGMKLIDQFAACAANQTAARVTRHQTKPIATSNRYVCVI